MLNRNNHKTVKVEEPDINNRLTAVLVVPDAGVSRLLKHLPTLSAGDSRQQAITASKQDIENAKAEGWASYPKGAGIKYHALGSQIDSDRMLENDPDHEHSKHCDTKNNYCWDEILRDTNYQYIYSTCVRWGNVDMITVRENPYKKEVMV